MTKKNKFKKLFKEKVIRKIFKPKKKNTYKLVWILGFIVLFDVILFNILTIKYSTSPINNNGTTLINQNYNLKTNKLIEAIDTNISNEIYPKADKIIQVSNITEKIQNTENINKVVQKIEENKTTKEKTNIKVNKIIPNNAKDYVQNFYNYINNNDYIGLVEIFDTPFKNDNTIKTYFSEKRLNNFIDSTNGTLKTKEIIEITEDRKDTNSIIKRSYKYLLKYNINNIDYKESWKMVLVSRNGGENFLVNSLFCESNGCSKSPFYK